MLMLISGFWKMFNSENKNTAVLNAWKKYKEIKILLNN